MADIDNIQNELFQSDNKCRDLEQLVKDREQQLNDYDDQILKLESENGNLQQ